MAHGILRRATLTPPLTPETLLRRGFPAEAPSSAGRGAQTVLLKERAPSGTEPVVSGDSSSSILRTRCVPVPASRSTIDAGTRSTSTPTSRAQIVTNTSVPRNGPCHHPSHRLVVREGTPVR